MRRAVTIFAVGAALAGLAFGIFASADAPKEQYGVFDGTNPTVYDQQTHLEWQRWPERWLTPDGGAGDAGSNGTIRTSQGLATQRCAAFGPGWRLPTVKELQTLVDEEPHRLYDAGAITYRWVDRNAFPETEREPYWTSSTTNDGRIWTVHFGTGKPMAVQPSDTHFGRCVKAR